MPALKDKSRYNAGQGGLSARLETMNILIENADSLEYFVGDHRWTKIAADGKPFPRTAAAFELAKKEAVGKFNIVGYIAETRQLINLNHGRGRGLLAEIQPV